MYYSRTFPSARLIARYATPVHLAPARFHRRVRSMHPITEASEGEGGRLIRECARIVEERCIISDNKQIEGGTEKEKLYTL